MNIQTSCDGLTRTHPVTPIYILGLEQTPTHRTPAAKCLLGLERDRYEEITTHR